MECSRQIGITRRAQRCIRPFFLLTWHNGKWSKIVGLCHTMFNGISNKNLVCGLVQEFVLLLVAPAKTLTDPVGTQWHADGFGTLLAGASLDHPKGLDERLFLHGGAPRDSTRARSNPYATRKFHTNTRIVL
jgi:hypothetical protein